MYRRFMKLHEHINFFHFLSLLTDLLIRDQLFISMDFANLVLTFCYCHIILQHENSCKLPRK